MKFCCLCNVIPCVLVFKNNTQFELCFMIPWPFLKLLHYSTTLLCIILEQLMWYVLLKRLTVDTSFITRRVLMCFFALSGESSSKIEFIE